MALRRCLICCTAMTQHEKEQAHATVVALGGEFTREFTRSFSMHIMKAQGDLISVAANANRAVCAGLEQQP